MTIKTNKRQEDSSKAIKKPANMDELDFLDRQSSPNQIGLNF